MGVEQMEIKAKANYDKYADLDPISVMRAKSLHPLVIIDVLEALLECHKNGYPIRITSATRTWEEQKKLHEAYVKGGPVAAKAGYSWHNYGLAVDFVLLRGPKQVSWDMSADFNKDGKRDWLQVIYVFKARGWESGIDWKGKKNDPPHLQKRFGLSIAKAIGLKSQGHVDPAGFIKIDGIKSV
jgi:peptidoglycan L-alanyl-D-glutamate endopeptidase CwlK